MLNTNSLQMQQPQTTYTFESEFVWCPSTWTLPSKESLFGDKSSTLYLPMISPVRHWNIFGCLRVADGPQDVWRTREAEAVLTWFQKLGRVRRENGKAPGVYEDCLNVPPAPLGKKFEPNTAYAPDLFCGLLYLHSSSITEKSCWSPDCVPVDYWTRAVWKSLDTDGSWPPQECLSGSAAAKSEVKNILTASELLPAMLEMLVGQNTRNPADLSLNHSSQEEERVLHLDRGPQTAEHGNERSDNAVTEQLISVLTDGVIDKAIPQAVKAIRSGHLTVNERLFVIDSKTPIPPTTSSGKLGDLLGCTGTAIRKTDWWKKNRQGRRDDLS